LNKTIIFGSAIGIAALVYLMIPMDKDLSYHEVHMQETATEKTIKSTRVNIITERTGSTIEKKGTYSRQVRKQIPINKRTKDPTVRYITTDNSNRYELSIIDEAIRNEEPSAVKREVIGKINGNAFVLKIPLNLVDDDLKLRVTDRKTKEKKTVVLSFAQDLKMQSAPVNMEMDFEDADNYVVASATSGVGTFP
jgi:hypothetical protein